MQLNEQQMDAVRYLDGPLLVLAGAGSGKTRVLVHRIAWLVQVEAVSSWGILAVTFTNKAAREMRHRIEDLLGQPAGGMWVGTFHGLAHRLLRAHWQEANLPKSFQILDSDDQHRLVKRVIKELNLDDSKWPPRQAQWFINSQKDEGRRPQHLDHGGDPHQRTMIQIYETYQAACERTGVVDFAELLLRAHELWRDRPDMLQHYQQRFSHILVDEFQDTNTIQYAWLRLLAGDRDNLFVVGDDDQSIYGWRGAKVENIQDLIKTVKEKGSDFGVGYDGDGDRIGVVDDQGQIIWGDKLLMIFAQDILKNHPGASIIFEVKCSQALPEMIDRFGGNPVMWKTGHSLLKKKMKEINLVETKKVGRKNLLYPHLNVNDAYKEIKK